MLQMTTVSSRWRCGQTRHHRRSPSHGKRLLESVQLATSSSPYEPRGRSVALHFGSRQDNVHSGTRPLVVPAANGLWRLRLSPR